LRVCEMKARIKLRPTFRSFYYLPLQLILNRSLANKKCDIHHSFLHNNYITFRLLKYLPA
jgi:hypothetical protein